MSDNEIAGAMNQTGMKWIFHVLIIASIPACKNSSVVNTAHKGANVNILAERDSVFLAMINEEVVTAAEEKHYISNTTELISLHPLACDSMSIHYREIINEDTIDLRIRLKPFALDEHDISYDEENANQPKLIDGKDPWGCLLSATANID